MEVETAGIRINSSVVWRRRLPLPAGGGGCVGDWLVAGARRAGSWLDRGARAGARLPTVVAADGRARMHLPCLDLNEEKKDGGVASDSDRPACLRLP